MMSSLRSNQIGIDKCVSYSSDNASLMTGKQKGVLGRLLEEQPKLIPVGCPCHLLHLAAASGAKMLGFSAEDFLVDVYYHFDKSVNRKQKFREYAEFAGEDVRKILKHVSTRWLSRGKCIDRILMKWVSLKGYFITNFDEDGEDEWPRHEKRKKSVPTTESREQRLVRLFKCPLTKVYLLFLSAVLPMFDQLNQLLQSDEPQIHILFPCMIQLYRKLMSCFIEPSHLAGTSDNDILKVDVENEEIHVRKEELFVGYITQQALKVPELDSSSALKFYKEAKQFCVKVLTYMKKKFPLEDVILQNITFIDPRNRIGSKFEQVVKVIEQIPEVVPEENMNDLHQEFLQYRSGNDNLDEGERIDEFWQRMSEKIDSVTLQPVYQNLVSIAKLILLIPHSNSYCETIFSMVKKVQTDSSW